jgi:hypothetical protein
VAFSSAVLIIRPLIGGDTRGGPVDALPHRIEVEQYSVGLPVIWRRGRSRGRHDYVRCALYNWFGLRLQSANLRVGACDISLAPYERQATVRATPMQKIIRKPTRGIEARLQTETPRLDTCRFFSGRAGE